jgi:hypothetical protein
MEDAMTTPDHTSRAHATLGASGASRWIACPGSVRLSKGMPNVSSVFAQEGTAAHELADKCLTTGKNAIEFEGDIFEEHEVDEDMAEAVQVYVDAVRKEAEGGQLFIEQRFTLEDLNPPVPMFGTADAVIWNATTKTLTVMDLKFGAGVPVKVENSPQLSYYALGAMLALEKSHGIFPERVKMGIVQPRYRHPDGYVRWFEIDSFTLRSEWADFLIQAAYKTLDDDAPIVPGDHCKFCLAQAKCPRLHEQAVALAQSEFDDGFSPPEPESLSDSQIADILEKASTFKSWLVSVEAYAKDKMMKGGHIPGRKLVEKRAQRKWVDEQEAVDLLEQMGLEEDDIYTRKLISPAQAEGKLGKKKAITEQLATIVSKQSTGYTIAPITDKRPAVVLTVGDEFDDVDALEFDGFKNFD